MGPKIPVGERNRPVFKANSLPQAVTGGVLPGGGRFIMGPRMVCNNGRYSPANEQVSDTFNQVLLCNSQVLQQAITNMTVNTRMHDSAAKPSTNFTLQDHQRQQPDHSIRRCHSGRFTTYGDEVVPASKGSGIRSRVPCAPISRPLPEIVKAVRFDKPTPNAHNVPVGRQHMTTYFNKTTPSQPGASITPLPMHVLQPRTQNEHMYRNDATWEPVRAHGGSTRMAERRKGRVAWVEACWW